MQLSITTAYRIILASVGLVLCLVLSIEAATAQTNPQINYQGKLTTSSGVAVPNGTYNMRFWLLSGPSVATSSALWTESLTTTSRVQVTNGLFSVMLGSTTPLTSVDWNQTLYLAVEIGGTSTTPVWDGEMSPRKVIGTVPAAFEARRLEGVASSSFLRSDEADTMAATTSGTLLSVIQNGAGAIARFFSGVTEVFTIAGNGNVGVGTSTPSQAFTVVGNTRITGALFDGNNASGTSGMILQTTGTTTRWVATSTLGYLSGGSSLSDLGDVTITTPGSGQLLSYNGSQWVNVATSSLGLGGVTFSNSSQLAALLSDETGTGAAVFGTGATLASTTLTGTTYLSGNVGIGTTSPNSLLALERSSVSGTTTALFDFNLGLANSSVGAVQYGGLTNIVTTNTATTSIVGNLLRITDSTSYGNTVRGLEVQTNRGTNTFGENTAISGFGRTFGVRGTTEGDAGSVLEPAGIYGVTRGTTQGNAIRGYSSSITTASLLSLFQDTSAFAGTGLLMNFGNTSGSFSSSTSKFLDLQVAGVSRFTINASGSVTIGDGVNDAGLTVRGSATTTNLRVTGAFRDSVNSAGTSGMVLQSTGTSTRWVATSSLGVGSGGATVIDDLSDVVITTPATGNTLVYNGANWVNQATSTLGFLANASIDTSSELAAILGDETGTGSVVFSANPTFTGTATFANLFGTTATITSATSTNLAATRLNMAGDSITDFTGTGLTVTGNALTVSTSTLGLAAGFFAQSGNSFGAAAVLGTNDNNVLQFETNGTVNMTLATSGNLGIGTTSPTARLAIDTSSLGSTPALMIASSTGRVSLMVANNGFVGMGTKNPQYPFHFSDSGFNNNAFFENLTSHSGISIKSAGGFASYISFDSDGNGTGLFGLKGSGNDPAASDLGYHFLQSGGINDPSIMTLNRVSNNLGLGTTTPQNRITVIGYNNYPLLDLASSSGQSLLRVAANGSLGLGTTSPSARLTIAGDLRLTGRFADASSSTGSVGQVLMATATGTQWVSTSTLGFGTGGSGTVYLASTSPWTTNDLAQVVSNGTLRSIATSSLGLFGVTGNSIASAQLLASLSDETGTGSVVFSANSTFTGTATFANLFGTTATITSATSTNLGLTRLNMNGDSITDFSGTGLQVVNNNLTVATSTLGLIGGGGAANRVAYFSDASTLTTSANFTYDGTNFGLGGTDGIAFGGTRFITASSGNNSIAFGVNAGGTLTATHTYNVAVGYNTGAFLAGTYNISMGYDAGGSSIGDMNLMLGFQAGEGNVGSNNTFLGRSAGEASVGDENVFIGRVTGISNVGSYNSFIGSWAGTNNIGSFNEMIGYEVGDNIQSTSSVLIGTQAFTGSSTFTAVNNVAIGYRAGYSARTGASNNIFLGYQAAKNINSGANNIVIGYDVDIASTTGSNQLNIGNLLFGTGVDGTGTTLSTGNIGIGTTSPSARLTISGDMRLTGRFADASSSTGAVGQILMATASGTQWVATSTLGGGGGGATTFLALTDTPSSYTANNLIYTNSGASALTNSSDLVFTGTNFGIGSSTPLSRLTVVSTDGNENIALFGNDNRNVMTRIIGDNGSRHGAFVSGFYDYGYAFDYSGNPFIGDAEGNGYDFFVDRGTGFVGIGTTTPWGQLTVSGGIVGEVLTLDTLDDIIFTTPVGSPVRTKINIPLYDPGAFNQLVAMGLPSTANTSARAISLFDARTSAHQPTLGVFSPDENSLFGFSWEGSNTYGYIKAVGSNIGIRSDTTDIATFLQSGNVGIGTTSPIARFTVVGQNGEGAIAIFGNDDINVQTRIVGDSGSDHGGFVSGVAPTFGYAFDYSGNPFIGDTNSSASSLFVNRTNSFVGIGTSSPSTRLTVAGDMRLTGRFADASSSTGSVGQLLMATAAGTQWVSTSTLGLLSTTTLDTSAELAALLGDETGTGSVVFSANPTFTGTATFANLFGTTATITSATTTNLGLTRLNMNGDSITDFSGTGLQVVNNNLTVATSTLGLVGGGGAANRVAYFSDASTLTTSANFTYDGTNFGLGGTNGIAFGGTRFITASSGNDSITFGEGAGAAFSTTTTFNIAIGAFAGNNSTASTSDSNIFLGSSAGRNSSNDLNIFIGGSAGRDNTGRLNTFIGNNAGDNNTGNTNIGIGDTAGFDNTGRENIFLGISAGTSNSGSYNNFIGSSAGAANNGNYNDFIGYFAGSGLKATATVLVGAESFGLTGNFSAVNNTAIGYRAGYAAQTGASNNVLLGYQAADNLTTGANNIVIGYDVDIASTTGSNQLNIGNLLFGTGINGTSTTLSTGNIGIGTTSPSARLTIAGVAGQDMLRIASSTGSTTLALLANGNLELSGQLVSAGVSWNTLAPLPVSYDWFGVTYGAGRYVAVGNGAVMYSSDALNWSTTTAAGNNDVWISVTYGNGRFVAVGSNGDRVMYSDDGITWATTTAAGNNDGWRDVTYGNGRFVAVGGGATDRTMYSDDGVNWTSVSAVGNNDTWNDVTYGNNRFVAVGDVGDRVMYSTDGVTWLTPATSTAADKNDGWNGVTYGDGRFVAVGDSGDRVMYSTDGITWTVTGAGLSGGFQDVEYGEGIFVAVGDAGWPEQIITSSDGINWTVRDGNFASFGLGGYYKLTYGNGRFVGIGDYAGYNVLYSGKLNESLPFASNALQGNWSVMSRFGVGTTSRAASLFVQAQSGVTPFTVASSTGANLFSVTGAGSLALDGSSAIGNGNIFSGVTSLTSTSTLTKYSTVFGESSLAGATRLRYSSIYGDSNSFTGNAVGNSSMSYSSIYGNSNAFSNGSYLYTSALYGTSNTFAADAYLNDSSLFGTTNSFGLYGTLDLSHLSGDNNTLRDYAVLDRSVVYGSSNIFATSSTVTNTAIFGNSNTASGTVSSAFVFGNSNSITSASNVFAVGNSLGTLRSNFATFYNLLNIDNASGSVGIGTTTSSSRLALRNTGITGTTSEALLLDQYLGLANVSAGAVQIGNRFNLVTTNTATTTIVGSIFRIQDSTTYGNTLRGLEVQAQRGTNTLGENTALSGFARTFGVRGTTEGDAGAIFEPAGVYGETRGTTQGNAIRGYSSTITTASLLSLFQDSSTFAGTGLSMNFGNAGGSFSSTSSRFLDFRVSGTSRFVVNASGTVTIGDGTNAAGLQIGRGGLCVDSDGSCNASTSGHITAVAYATNNSDLAENYFSNDGLLAGEIVALSGGLSVDRAEVENATAVIGVVSTAPGLTLGADDSSLRPGEQPYPIALSGRVPIRLSNENGPVRKGDQIMLSSVPGIGMKATGTGLVIGVALEDFDAERAYSETYISQFGENLITPEYPPFVPNDPRINDGCYYGGGAESGAAPCVPLQATTTDGQQQEAERLAAIEAKERALRNLARTPSEERTLADGRRVLVGQITMFVDRGYRYLTTEQEVALAALMSTSTGAYEAVNADEPTLFDRMAMLASSFVDGVLSIFRLETEEVQTDKLCVGTTCVDEETLRRLLESDSGAGAGNTPAPVVAPPVTEPEYVPPVSGPLPNEPGPTDDPPAPEVVPSGDGGGASAETTEEPPPAENEEPSVPNTTETEPSEPPAAEVLLDEVTQTPPTNPEITP